MEGFKGKFFPCPICKRKLPIKISKKNKPYFVCNSCGFQGFVRKEEGIEGLRDIVDGLFF